MPATTCLIEPRPATSPNKPPGESGEKPPAEMLAERRAFLGISDDDCRRVGALQALADDHLDSFVERFYDHLLQFPATRAFLRDPLLVQHLKQTQKAYFRSLLEAQLDESYVADRRRIGRAHADAGLEPEWFLGAYNLYIQDWFRFLAECGADSQPASSSSQPDRPAGDRGRLETCPTHDGSLREYMETTLSLLKLIVLDIGLALDAYFARSTEHIRAALALYAQTNAELQEFANLASHDLKTPVATVTGLCEEFLDEFGSSVPVEGRRLIEAARQRTLRMSAMLDDLLAASVAAAESSQRTRVSSRALLDEAIEPLHEQLEAKQITVEVIEPLPVVIVHPARLRSVFQNLLSNAVKFVDHTPSRIWVSAETTDGETVFCVEDEGPGIAPEDQRTLFAPFHRLPQHRDQPGAGLGLYFVKKLIEEQGGHVWVESEPGTGSRFFVSLPTCWSGPETH